MAKTRLTSREGRHPKELFIFARFHAREGQQGAVAAALREELPQSRAEPGCLAIEAFRSTRNPQLFFIHSRWVDEAAFETHAEMPHTVRFIERVEPLIDHELDVNRTRPLGAPKRLRKATLAKHFAVTRERGPAWNNSLSMREQKRWREHAAFMDSLANEGFVILGGPLGRDERRFLLIFKADSAKTIEARLAADPWTPMGLLRIFKIEPWEILLGQTD